MSQHDDTSVDRVSRIERLEIDVDTRMTELWAQAGAVEEWDVEIAAKFMRAAYGRGYIDALEEPVRGRLCRENGYRTPTRRGK